ncbi:MAG: HAD family hydrolase [Desulfobacterales bacterium]|nr:HAD family hydrolase [Desulfobacterales bacterium]
MVSLSVNQCLIRDVRLVIFDKDGTLIELYRYWSQMVALRARLICRALGLEAEHEPGLRGAMGLDDAAGRLKPEGPVGLKKRAAVIQAAAAYLAGCGRGDAGLVCTQAFDRADEESCRDPGRFIRPIPGAGSLIGALRRNGCRVAVATVDLSQRARLALDFLGWSARVDLVAGGDAVRRPKPDPEMVELILAELGVDRSRAVMVGDAATDVEMGRRAGLKASIGVLSGMAAADALMEFTPHIARDVSQILLASDKN